MGRGKGGDWRKCVYWTTMECRDGKEASSSAVSSLYLVLCLQLSMVPHPLPPATGHS